MSFRYTQEELDIAKSVDLVSIAEYLGFTPKKVGSYYTFKEIDSMRIYNRNSWYRFSKKNENGYFCGSQIEFLEEFAGLSFRQAVKWLLDYVGYVKDYSGVDKGYTKDCFKDNRSEEIDGRVGKGACSEKMSVRSGLVLPDPAETNNRVYDYLNKKRRISSSVIDFFISKGLLYESKDYHNAVFKGFDSDGKLRFASMRGTYDMPGKKPYKQDVTGSDKNYGFNLSSGNGNTIVVFEGAIDLMSYVDISRDFDMNMLALGMTNDKPLNRFLKEHPNVNSIMLFLDNDKPGREATEAICNKYKSLGFNMIPRSIPDQYKDINEWLVKSKLTPDSVAKVLIK